ncbi:MAG TPA: pyridoxamine 5'-phosphate oxidase family protein [Spirochaetia bacterium]|nr:pyridoxamine 5'-phosphate oxidase family protein [Spirochaetia bacterium]
METRSALPEKLVTDQEEITRVLDACTTVFLSFRDDPAPYVVPLFFGHEPGRLYMHCSIRGTKLALMSAHAQVGFSAATPARIVEGKDACAFTAIANSVAGTGVARLVEEEEERRHALDLIMSHYAPGRAKGGFSYREEALSRTSVIAVDVVRATAKRIGPAAG